MARTAHVLQRHAARLLLRLSRRSARIRSRAASLPKYDAPSEHFERLPLLTTSTCIGGNDIGLINLVLREEPLSHPFATCSTHRGACAWGCSAAAAGFSSWGIPPNAALEFTIEVLRIESGRSTALSGKVGGLMGGHAGGDDGGGAGGDGGAPRTAASAAAFSSAAAAHLSASGGAPTAAAGAACDSGAAATAETGAVAQSGGTPAPSAPSTRNVWLELD